MSYEHSISEHEIYAHAVPLRVLLAVFAVLLLMTLLTVASTWYDLGSWNLIIALGIATFKAALVVLFFMHLRYDYPFYAIVLITALLFLRAVPWADTARYAPIPGRHPSLAAGTAAVIQKRDDVKNSSPGTYAGSSIIEKLS